MTRVRSARTGGASRRLLTAPEMASPRQPPEATAPFRPRCRALLDVVHRKSAPCRRCVGSAPHAPSVPILPTTKRAVMIATNVKAPAQRQRPARRRHSLRRLGHEQSLRHRPRLCRRRLRFILADRRDVRSDRARRDQLHHHLPALSGWRRCLRERASSLAKSSRSSAHFLLIADYLVTAAISALSAFQYLGVPHPENIRGRRHSRHRPAQSARAETHRRSGVSDFGSDRDRRHRARAFSACRISGTRLDISSRCTAASCITGPALSESCSRFPAWRRSRTPPASCGSIPGSTEARPSVRKTSTPAILWVMIEVCLFTALLGLAMHALGGLQVVERRRQRARRGRRARLHAALHGRGFRRRRARSGVRPCFRLRRQHCLWVCCSSLPSTPPSST